MRLCVCVYVCLCFIQVVGDLEYWKQRPINVISWSAMEMLFNERQLKYYRQDADLPRSAAFADAHTHARTKGCVLDTTGTCARIFPCHTQQDRPPGPS